MKFQFLKTEWMGEHEFAYVLDTESGAVFRSPVRTFASSTPLSNGASGAAEPRTIRIATPTALAAEKEPASPAGEVETAEERSARLGRNKVPPAFLGDIRKMNLDPSKTEGRTDVTPFI